MIKSLFKNFKEDIAREEAAVIWVLETDVQVLVERGWQFFARLTVVRA